MIIEKIRELISGMKAPSPKYVRGENVIRVWKPTLMYFLPILMISFAIPVLSLSYLIILPSRALALFFALSLAFGTLLFLFIKAVQDAYKYTLTNKSVKSEFRLIVYKLREAPLNAVTDISVEQDIVGRVFNFGNIFISTAGTIFPGVILKGVKDPYKTKYIISRYILSAGGKVGAITIPRRIGKRRVRKR